MEQKTIEDKELSRLQTFIDKKVMAERGYALVWMSAGNSYFKEEIIKKILRFTGEHFSKTIVMAPDEPAEHTFRALGYPGNEGKKKARLNANLLQNRAKRVIAASNNSAKYHLVEWMDEIINNAVYRDKLKQVYELYNSNLTFKTDAHETTKEVLLGKTKNDVTETAVCEAVHYLLKELAFVMASPDIYKCSKVTYIYHKSWLIYKKFIEGQYDGLPKENLGFILFN